MAFAGRSLPLGVLAVGRGRWSFAMLQGIQCLLLPACLLAFCNVVGAVSVPAEVSDRLANGEAVDVIVEYDASEIERDMEPRRAKLPGRIADAAWLATLRGRYRQLKDAADTTQAIPDADLVQEYSHLPMRTLHLRSPRALAALAAHPQVRGIYSNDVMQRVQAAVAPGLVQIDQPAVAAVGYTGSGTTVAVIDDGIDLSNAAFGCTGVGTPAGCRVVASQTLVSTPGSDFSHGTNVSAIVASVAPGANIAMLNVFTATGASNSTIIAAINWVIANRSTYNIAAINMSLGDSGHYTSACSTGNSYLTPVANARAAGISVVAAAGNSAYLSNVFTPGLPSPACTPGVISVGAVYNANVGGLQWGTAPNQCIDYTSRTDQIVCFSQSASNLTLLAPGAIITAGGITMGGTSQASPHAAGTVAVLRSAFPSDSLATTLTRLTSSAVQITDARNGVTTPRLMMDVAAQPANDTFGARQAVTGVSGSASGANFLASLSTDTAVPASAGTSPVWWTWTAPGTGQVTLSTTGSSFATQLAVYTGSALASLQLVTGATNVSATVPTSQVVFEAQAGNVYQWAVGGAGGAGSGSGATGDVALQWSLNTAAVANLSSAISGPASAVEGTAQSLVLSVKNNGPQTATNVSVALALPAATTLLTVPSGCTLATSGTTLNCVVAALGNGATASWNVSLSFGAAGGETLSTSVTSDLPDPSISTSTASLTVQTSSGNSDGDVPLPAWALVLLATGMLVSAHWANGRYSNR